MSMIDKMSPASGNVVGADGKVYNLVTLMGGGEPVSDTVYDVGSFQPRSALILGEDGKVYDLVKLIQSGGGGDLSGYVKKTDYANSTEAGVVKVRYDMGFEMYNGSLVTISPASIEHVRKGDGARRPLVPSIQHVAAFYGLAKAAGVDEKASSLDVGTYSDEAQKAIRNMISADASDFALLVKKETEDDGFTVSSEFNACREIYAHVYIPRSDKNTEAKTVAIKLNDSGYVIGYMLGLKPQYSNMFNIRIRVLSDERAVYSLSYVVDSSEFGNWYAGSSAMAVEKMIVVNVAGGISRFTFEGEGKSFVLPKGTKMEIYGR